MHFNPPGRRNRRMALWSSHLQTVQLSFLNPPHRVAVRHGCSGHVSIIYDPRLVAAAEPSCRNWDTRMDQLHVTAETKKQQL